MKKQKILIGLVILSAMLLPLAASAQPKTIGSIEQLIDAIKRPLWLVFGLIALIAFVIAGILFLTAGGDPDKIKQARTAFLWGVVGVVVGIIAYSVVTIIENMI